MRKVLAIALPLIGLAAATVARAQDDFKGPGTATSASGSASTSATTTSKANDPKADPYAEPSTTPSASAKGPPKPKRPPPKEEDPLIIPEGIKDEIGSSHYHEDKPLGERSRVGLFPLAYKERVGNQITSSIFPIYYDRKVVNDAKDVLERESFYGLYYRKRSKLHDVDAAFPLFFRWRDEQTTTTIVPPVLWRDGPKGEWHRWLAPLFFASSQPDGGYFHAPLLLTFSHHNPKTAFSLIGGIGFYDRKERDIDWGVVPFIFSGSNADKLTSYTFIPPLLSYFSSDRDSNKSLTVIGPVIYKTSPGNVTFDILPLFLHHKDEDVSSTTFLPFFHNSSNKKDGTSLFATPLFLTSRDQTGGRTIVTPLYSQYRGRTTLDLAGPIVPLFAHYHDPDRYRDTWLLGPVLYSNDPTKWSVLTPLFGHWQEYGVSRSTWIFPTFHHVTEPDGWAFNIHPFLYTGRSGKSSHNVLAPIFWDFVAPKKRSTVVFPVFWRFADDEGTTQLALNTLYLEKPSSKGPNWDFYFLPLFHVGEQPQGSAWDVLFGFVGYKREGSYKQLKLFWIPIDLTKPTTVTK
jgi:hypothetical protein